MSKKRKNKEIPEQKNNIKKMIITIILLGFFLTFSQYISNKIDTKENWIKIEATVKERKLYKSSKENKKYKYKLSYTIKGKKYQSYFITTEGSTSDINKKIKIYVNKNNLEKIKISNWNTY